MLRTDPFLSDLLPVRAASRARIRFDVTSPRRTEVVIQHLRTGELLAHECRPLADGADSLEIKTHPEASHIACLLKAGGRPIDRARFAVDCGQRIEPVARHFIVIGAMKAGTTTLFELLAQHPALCRTWTHLPDMSSAKEINYFRKLHRDGDSPLHYDWRFPFDPARHSWTLDVSPSYAQWPGSRGVPARIASLGAETKLAYILREPIDRIESHLAHKLHFGGHTTLQHCIRTSRYAMQLDRFTSCFARDDILLLDFEELTRDPGAILAQICDFLSIDHFSPSSVVHNKRRLQFRLDAGQRAELADAVHADVERLINLYGFTPAERWVDDRRGS